MHANYIIANDKGGVGKSTIAQYCILHLMRTVGEVRPVEYDRQPKLQRFFGDGIITQSIGPEWERQFNDPASLATFWDPMVKWFQVKRPLVADFGAQVWSYFHAWADSVMLPEIIDSSRVTVLIPVTADAEAVVGALRVVRSAPAVLPKARLVLLLCDKDGEVTLLQGMPEFRELREAVDAGRVEMRIIPVLSREGYPLLASKGLRFDQISKAKPVEIVHATGATLTVASRTIKAVRTWMDAMEVALSDVLVAYQQAPNKVGQTGSQSKQPPANPAQFRPLRMTPSGAALKPACDANGA